MINSTVSNTDRGFMYGDGLFTTYRIMNGQVCHLDEHLARLENGRKKLKIAPFDISGLKSAMLFAAKEQKLAVGKVVLTRGEGGRGYSPGNVDGPNLYLQSFPFPKHVKTQRKQGIDLRVASLQLAIQPALVGIKHLNRLEQVLGKQEIVDKGWSDAVFCDTSGYVVECNSANLFWRRDEVVYTSALTDSGVSGIMRGKIIEHCRKNDHRVEEVQVYPAMLEEVDEIFTCNSVCGPVPVVHFNEYRLPSHFLCRMLQKELDPLNG